MLAKMVKRSKQRSHGQKLADAMKSEVMQRCMFLAAERDRLQEENDQLRERIEDLLQSE